MTHHVKICLSFYLSLDSFSSQPRRHGSETLFLLSPLLILRACHSGVGAHCVLLACSLSPSLSLLLVGSRGKNAHGCCTSREHWHWSGGEEREYIAWAGSPKNQFEKWYPLLKTCLSFSFLSFLPSSPHSIPPSPLWPSSPHNVAHSHPLQALGCHPHQGKHFPFFHGSSFTLRSLHPVFSGLAVSLNESTAFSLNESTAFSLTALISLC